MGVFTHEHAQCAAWVKLQNKWLQFIADWTIVMGNISIVGLALATSELATTDLPERSHRPGPDFKFSKTFVWEHWKKNGISL